MESPGKRRTRPRNTWQRDTEKETKEMRYTRREMEKMATDRKRWRSWSMAHAPSEQKRISNNRKNISWIQGVVYLRHRTCDVKRLHNWCMPVRTSYVHLFDVSSTSRFVYVTITIIHDASSSFVFHQCASDVSDWTYEPLIDWSIPLRFSSPMVRISNCYCS